MASIGKDPNGHRRILFVAGDGRRKTIRLGKMNAKHAGEFRTKVEDLITAQFANRSMEDETAVWLGKLENKMHARLAAVGLVKPRTTGQTRLIPFLDAYLESRPDYKYRSRENMGQVRRWFIAFFGENVDMRNVGPAEAEDFFAFMQKNDLNENTARRHIGRARQLFRAAIRRGILRTVNPFEGMSVTVRADKERQFFITQEAAAKLIDACPNTQWKLLVALSRYGGLRCPSEHLMLKWTDVDWGRNRIRVPSPKTERHAGKDCRIIPIFPELRPWLLKAFEEAEPGSDYVIVRTRDQSVNLRTHLLRIIARAGLKTWPKPWHNMRSTRQTELAEKYPIHVVCAWLGNSREVAMEHYLQVTDTHYDDAAGVTAPTPEPAKEADEKAAQNPAQYAAASDREEMQTADAQTPAPLKLQGDTASDGYLPDDKYPRPDSNRRPAA